MLQPVRVKAESRACGCTLDRILDFFSPELENSRGIEVWVPESYRVDRDPALR